MPLIPFYINLAFINYIKLRTIKISYYLYLNRLNNISFKYPRIRVYPREKYINFFIKLFST